MIQAEIAEHFFGEDFKSNTDANYITTESNENVEIAYYFPLRNEKNVKFLENHLQYLQSLMDQYYKRVEKNEAINDSLRHKYTELIKDIQIIQKRLISIKKVFQNAMNAESKAEMALYNAFNIQANVKLKIELINSMKAEYNEEYIRFYDKYKKEEEDKVKSYSQELFDRKGPSIHSRTYD